MCQEAAQEIALDVCVCVCVCVRESGHSDLELGGLPQMTLLSLLPLPLSVHPLLIILLLLLLSLKV